MFLGVHSYNCFVLKLEVNKQKKLVWKSTRIAPKNFDLVVFYFVVFYFVVFYFVVFYFVVF